MSEKMKSTGGVVDFGPRWFGLEFVFFGRRKGKRRCRGRIPSGWRGANLSSSAGWEGVFALGCFGCLRQGRIVHPGCSGVVIARLRLCCSPLGRNHSVRTLFARFPLIFLRGAGCVGRRGRDGRPSQFRNASLGETRRPRCFGDHVCSGEPVVLAVLWCFLTSSFTNESAHTHTR